MKILVPQVEACLLPFHCFRTAPKPLPPTRPVFLMIYYVYLFLIFLAALGLRCCVWAFSSCGKEGLLFVAVHRLLIVVASLVAEHGLQVHGLQQLQHTGSVVAACRHQSMLASVVAVRGLWGAWASVVVVCGLNSCDAWAQLFRGMWDLPGPGIKLVSPALIGGFLTTVPPGKSLLYLFI